jgi:hypothetical protein
MTKLCPRGKAAAKRKFKVYPSAYANAYASKICAGKIKDPRSGVKRKDWDQPKKMKYRNIISKRKIKWLRLITGRAVKQSTETKKEFEMRHEYHTATKGMLLMSILKIYRMV